MTQELLSKSEIKRLRLVIECDWPGLIEGMEELQRKLTDAYDEKKAVEIINRSVDWALGSYRDCMYAVTHLGKLSDPTRLAAFVAGFVKSVSQEFELLGWLDTPVDSSSDVNRKKIYLHFFDGTIRETLRDNGYEQKILVGCADCILYSDAGNCDSDSNGLGHKSDR